MLGSAFETPPRAPNQLELDLDSIIVDDMKRFFTACLFLAFTWSVLGVDRADLDYRLRRLTLKFDAMQARADKRIPAKNLRQAQGIVLLERTKAGFLFAYQGGNGAAMVRDPKSGQWGAPAFVKANEASLGFQIGGQQSFII